MLLRILSLEPLSVALRSTRGFALPVVLLTLATLGSIATGVISRGTVGTLDVVSKERRVRDLLLIEAAIARGLHALLVSDDPLTEELLQGQPVTWNFANRVLNIMIHPEGNKLDLNASDPGALAEILDQTLGPELGTLARDAVLASRPGIATPDQVLPVLDRFSSTGARLRDAVTVFGGRAMAGGAPNASTVGNAPPLGNGRPIYTVRATLVGGSSHRSVIVLIEPERHRYIILDHAEFEGAGSPTLDQ